MGPVLLHTETKSTTVTLSTHNLPHREITRKENKVTADPNDDDDDDDDPEAIKLQIVCEAKIFAVAEDLIDSESLQVGGLSF